MQQRSKFQEGQQNQEATEHHAAGQEKKVFANVEEILREDVSEVQVPPIIAERLNNSIAAEPAAPVPAPWWKRIVS
jgi:hypothetical protein